jgi:hypothetical protein
VLRAAARRFATLLAAAAVVTAIAAAGLGALAGSSLGRSVSLGFYLVGSFLVVAGFVIGNRGPVRAKDDDGGAFLGIFAVRRRWADPEEHATTINDSALFVALGFVLILLGVAVDSRYELI